MNGKNKILNREESEGTQYLIICPSRFEAAAQSLADMHSDSVDADYRLNSEVIFVEDIANNADVIRTYILNRIESNDDLEYLLLFGDELDVPPIYNDDYPSDDFYSTDLLDIFSGNPHLISGRIPVSTVEDAWDVVDKIKNYTLHPTPGSWRSKVALVADDMFNSCSYFSDENSHTVNSDEIS